MKTYEELTNELLELFKNNEELFNNIIEDLDHYNGFLGDDRYYSTDDLHELVDNKNNLFIYDDELEEILDQFDELKDE